MNLNHEKINKIISFKLQDPLMLLNSFQLWQKKIKKSYNIFFKMSQQVLKQGLKKQQIAHHPQENPQSEINNQGRPSRDQRSKNETQHDGNQVNKEGSALEKFGFGMVDIMKKLQVSPGIDDFFNAFSKDEWWQDQKDSIQELHLKNKKTSQQVSSLKQLSHAPQIEHLNKTPFFGNEQQMIKSVQGSQINSKSVVVQIFQLIFQKSSQASNQLSSKYEQLFFSPEKRSNPEAILDRIYQKMSQAMQQITNNNELFGQELPKQEVEKAAEQNDDKSSKKVKAGQTQQENQFMTSEFGQHQKLEEIKQYVSKLKNQTVDKYIEENEKRQKNIEKFERKMKQFVDKKQVQIGFQKIKKRPILTPQKQKTESPNRDGNRAASGAMSQRISSAQSQRLKSAASKISENDQSFNLDLTVKTRNSKNPYQIGKQDSLMYSVDSGFGFHPESPSKMNRNDDQSHSNNSVKQKMDQIDELKQQNNGRKSNLQKSYSQRVEHQRSDQKKYKRMKSSKDKIEQNVHQVQGEDDDKKADGQDNVHKDYPQGADHQQGFFKPKYRESSQQQNHQSEEKLQVSSGKKQNNQGNQSKIKENKSSPERKNRKTQNFDHDDRSSIKDGTIIDKMDNFDADADDQDDQKQLHQSAHFKKKKSTEQLVRKRVQTQVTKNKKQLKNQNNYSIKNIKRFNKVDIAKQQQQQNTKRQNTQAVSHSVSNSNIFTTQIEAYQKKISRLKQQKQMKKKQLEKELARINYQLKSLNQKQEELSPQNKNNFASRVKISDNNEAQRKAESLVKNLRSQKRNRNLAKLGEFSNLDRNINDYMEQLTKLRAQNEEKTKQKKKLQILQRMKQNEVRKIKQKKKLSQNQQFVLQLKGVGGGSGPTQPISIKNEKQQIKSKRSPTKQQQEVPPPINMTPELNQKKAYLSKIRSFSVKKQTRDPYEQSLN